MSHNQVRLFLFPHSGVGSSYYNNVEQYYNENILVCPVQYPGRGDRLHENPITSCAELVDKVIADNYDILTDNSPLVFFGHCLGALIANEVLIKLCQNNMSSFVHFFISGCPAPHVHRIKQPISHLKNIDFLNEMQKLHHFQSASPSKSSGQITLASLKADFKIYEEYLQSTRFILPCAISAFYGNDDRYVSQSEINHWADLTHSGFTITEYNGDHLFINSNLSSLMKNVNDIILNHTEKLSS